MKKTLLASLGGALAVALVAGVADAHHAVNAQFDVTKEVVATGVLTKVELINPHSYMHFNVTEKGKTAEISMETGAPVALQRAGLSVRDNLKVGTPYKIVYSPSRNGSKTGLLHAITLSDGRFIGFGGEQNISRARELSKK